MRSVPLAFLSLLLLCLFLFQQSFGNFYQALSWFALPLRSTTRTARFSLFNDFPFCHRRAGWKIVEGLEFAGNRLP